MPRSQVERLWIGGALVIAFVITVIGYFFFISPQRDDTSDIEGQVATAQLANSTLLTRINSLDAENTKLASYQAALKQARLALPDSSDLPNFLRTLQSLGDATFADVTSLAVGAPTPVVAAATTAGGATPATPSPSASTAPAAAAAPTASIFELPITTQVSGTISQLTNFLGQLQSVQPRAVFVSAISLGTSGTTATSATAATTMTVTMSAFVAPGTAAESQQLANASGG